MAHVHAFKHQTVPHELSQRDEAIAVLVEMERLAERRLIEACGEFQDIAHEMEWRLLDWVRLTEEHKKLTTQIALTGRASPRFNLGARKVQGVRKDKWADVERKLAERRERNSAALEETRDTIHSRNDEGEVLRQEIFALEEKIQRIGHALRRLSRPPAIIVREGDAAAAIARLSVETHMETDLPDVATLIAAVRQFSEELAAAEKIGLADT